MAILKQVRKLANPGLVKLRKGSKEAKDYMARLRGMRKKSNTGQSFRKLKKRDKKTALPQYREYIGSRMSAERKDMAKKRTVRRKAKKESNSVAISNVGELVTLSLSNPRPRKRRVNNMARRRKVTRRRNTGVVANPRRRRYSARRRNVGRRVKRYSMRRRNPGQFQGMLEQVGGVIGGATLTGIIVGVLPPAYTQGLIGYGVTAAVAYAQGMAAGKVLKNPKLGDSMVVGGFTVLVLKVLSEFLPGLAVGLAPRGLGWVYANAPMTVKPMGRPFLAYNQPSGVAPAGMVSAPTNGNGVAGFSRGRVGFGR